MKKKAIQLTMVIALIFSSTIIFAANVNVKSSPIIQNDSTISNFKVYGNCGMCKRTIEGSLKNEKGINSAVWNKETKMIEVNYNQEIISLEVIKKKIAKVGYDTEEVRATEKAYNNLPGCCQYERPKSK